MVDYIPAEKGVVIRMPSVANLMVDSSDRTPAYPTPWQFQITKPQSLLNGFFTRVAATEVVLNWFEPNIVTGSNDEFTIEVTATSTSYTINLNQGTYTVAQVLDYIVDALNDEGTGLTWSITGVGANCLLEATGAFTIEETPLSLLLAFNANAPSSTYFGLFGPDLRPARYIDFTSSDLTYCQNVKDGTTNKFDNNVLCRWYFAWDNPPVLDEYGFPILMGYTPFSCRRLFSPAKQIKWESNMPIGNLNFKVVNEFNRLPNSLRVSTSWQMTLQLSEV
jgi:hypothetical protein